MPMRERPWAKELDPEDSKHNPDAGAPAKFLSSGEFEIISWLIVVGILISMVLTATYPAFDPAAAFLGQFP